MRGLVPWPEDMKISKLVHAKQRRRSSEAREERGTGEGSAKRRERGHKAVGKSNVGINEQKRRGAIKL